jgi:hypothetical protein
MNKTLGLQLVIYSLLLAGLSCFSHYLAPALARTTLIAGLAGGTLCLVWGLRSLKGNRSKVLPILTLVPVCFVLLSQTITGWASSGEGMPNRRTAAAVITLLFAMTLGMLMRIAYAGVVFYGQPTSPANDSGLRTSATGKSALKASAAKRA